MGLYQLISMRVNLTKEEVNEMSAETAKQMFQEMQLEELKTQDKLNKKTVDTISNVQLNKEVKVAFPFIDTVSNGWLTLPNSNKGIDTLPVVFYKTLKPANKLQTNQFYNFLRIRLVKDTVVLIKR